MSSLLSAHILHEASTGRIAGAISILIESAVAAFDADRNTSRRYLLRASAILRAQCATHSDARRGQEGQPPGGLATWQVNRIVDYIEQHLAEKISGQDLAELVNVSVGQMFRAFKVSVGVSPFHYISRRRIEFACGLLQTTREPLAGVAIASGLCDQSHLCRVFRRVMGVTPAMWRRANANDPELAKRMRSGTAFSASKVLRLPVRGSGAGSLNPMTQTQSCDASEPVRSSNVFEERGGLSQVAR